MRLGLFVLLLLLAAPAEAQPLAPGTRVRIAYPAASGGSDLVTGTVRSAGEWLAVETADGELVSLSADALDRVEVSTGERPFPAWMVTLGTAAGLGVGFAYAQSAPVRDRCRGAFGPSCGTERSGEYLLRIVAGVAVGAGAGTWAALRHTRERWVPAGELVVSPGAVSWRIGL